MERGGEEDWGMWEAENRESRTEIRELKTEKPRTGKPRTDWRELCCMKNYVVIEWRLIWLKKCRMKCRDGLLVRDIYWIKLGEAWLLLFLIVRRVMPEKERKKEKDFFRLHEPQRQRFLLVSIYYQPFS